MTRLLLARSVAVTTATVVLSLLAVDTAAARPVEGDGAAVSHLRLAAPSAPATPAQAVAQAVSTATSVRSGLVCELVRGLRMCSHGDDAHLTDAPTPRSNGGDASSTSSTRIGCYKSGPRVQAVYARPVTSADRYTASLQSFRGWAGAMEQAVDDSAHKTKGARHVRFVSTPSGSSCVLSVLHVALPPQAFASFSATVSALQDKGLDDAGVKYLVWSEGSGYCGIATAYDDAKPTSDNLNNGAFPSYARIDRKCWGRAETHELMHMLGAVQLGAPHATGGHHCRDGSDVMCYDDGTKGSTQTAACPASHARLLDCRSDDYFSTNPPARSWLATHWNTANSAFLARDWTDPAPTATASASPAPKASPAADPESDPQEPRPLLPVPVPTLGLVRS